MEYKLFDSIDEMAKMLEHGKPRLVRINEINLCVVRLGQNLHAFRNECPHMGESLHQGMINFLNEIACPLHAYRFNIESGECTTHTCVPLTKVEVKIEKDVILIL